MSNAIDNEVHVMYVIQSKKKNRTRYTSWSYTGLPNDIEYTRRLIYAKRFSSKEKAKSFLDTTFKHADWGDSIKIVRIQYNQTCMIIPEEADADEY